MRVHTSLLSGAIAVAAFAVLLSGPATVLTAQTESPWPVELAERAQAQVAAKWHVEAEELVMAWGPYRGEMPAPDASLVLLGTGAGGHWVVRAELWNGTTASVRLRTGAKVSSPVAGRRLERGEILGPLDIVTAEGILWGAPADDVRSVEVGWEVQRTIEEGGALDPPAVRPPLAVVSGRDVAIVWMRGSIGLRASARAAGSGAVGDRIFVRTESRIRLSGIIIAPGVVDVTQSSPERGPGE